MPLQVPMEITLVITKREEANGEPIYSARYIVGRFIPAAEGEVFRCGGAGKNFFECVTAIRKRALLFAKHKGLTSIKGLTDDGPCELALHCKNVVIEIVPVTYNEYPARHSEL